MANLTPQMQNDFKKQLEVFRGEVSKLLPSHISPEKFERVVYSVALRNPDLIIDVDRRSFFDACIQAATFGVIPDGKKCTIIKYGNKAQFTPMIGGIIEKLYNSGDISSIVMNLVYENDEFRYFVDDDGEHIFHKPELFKDRGNQVGVYASVKTKAGVFNEFMNMKELNAIRSVAKSKNIWDGSFGTEMHKKSVLRRLSKRLQLSEENERFVRSDDEMIDLSLDVRPSKAEETQRLLQAAKKTEPEILEPVTPIADEVPQVEPTKVAQEEQGDFANFNPHSLK